MHVLLQEWNQKDNKIQWTWADSKFYERSDLKNLLSDLEVGNQWNWDALTGIKAHLEIPKMMGAHSAAIVY